MNRKLIYQIHLWLSIPLGIIITVICLSGAALVFKNEIREALGMPKVIAHASQHKKAKTDVSSDSIMSFQKKAAEMKKAGMTDKPDFFTYTARLHKSLFAGKVGKYVVTYVTLFFIVILVTGIWIAWPKNRKQWKQRFSIDTKHGNRKLWFDLHTSLGFFAVLWILLLAVTGSAFGMHILPRGDVMKFVHELHVGSWGGMVTKVITFVACIIGATLPITGYYLYFKKHLSRKR